MIKPLKILLFGGCGLLGSRLLPALKKEGHQVLSQSRGQGGDIQIDPSNKDAIKEVVSRIKPDIVINLIAKTGVDDCESDIDNAFWVNTKLVEILSESLSRSYAKLVHISTDQVYTGRGFQTEFEARPQNVYALSKYGGELAALNYGGLVLRVNFICGALAGEGIGLANWLYRSLKNETPIKIFEDVLFNPVHPSYLAKAILKLTESSCHGIVNIGSIGGVSKAELARRICEEFAFNGLNMKSASSSDFAFKANRPNDMRMDTSK